MRSAASQLCGLSHPESILSRIAYALSHYSRRSAPDMAGVVPDKARAVSCDKIASQSLVTAQSLALSDFAKVMPSAVTSCAIKPYTRAHTRARAYIFLFFLSGTHISILVTARHLSQLRLVPAVSFHRKAQHSCGLAHHQPG